MKITLKKKYKPLVSEPSRYFIITGGRASGKSFSVSTYLLMLTFEKDHKILFTRYTMASAHISIIPEFVSKIEQLGLSDKFDITKTEIINKVTGSSIIFRGLRTSSGIQTANLKSINGITTWVLDEAEELVDEDIFNKIDLSIRTNVKQNRVIIVMNPATKEHFIYKRFFEDKGVQECSNTTKDDTTYIHTTYADNEENLSESIINQINALKLSNVTKYNHIIEGRWLNKAEGVIFENWEIKPFERQDTTIYGLDFGFSFDPSACVEVSVRNNLMYLKEIFYKQRMVTSDFVVEFNMLKKDELVVADSSENRLIEEISKKGINIIPIQKNPGSVVEGINFMMDYQIFIDPSSINLIKEFNNYSWSNKKAGQPIDKWNHCFVGSTLITTINGDVKIKDIKVGDIVLTSNGWKPVLKKFNNGKRQVNRYSLQLDTNKVILECTDNHKIKTTEGWKEIKNLKTGNVLYQHKPLTEKHITYTQMKDILVKEKKDYIELFGNITMDQSQKDIISTTLMEQPQIIELQTYNLLEQPNILNMKVKKEPLIIQSSTKNSTLKELNWQKSGIVQEKDLNGINNTERILGKTENSEPLNVMFVTKNTQQDIVESPNTVVTTVNLKHLEIEESWVEEVYDIMVEECHEYFANGILVHNCIDAVRYVTMHLKKNNHGSFDYDFEFI